MKADFSKKFEIVSYPEIYFNFITFSYYLEVPLRFLNFCFILVKALKQLA